MSNEEIVMQVHGYTGDIEVYENRIVIKPRGRMSLPGGKVNEIFFENIRSIQFRPSSMVFNGCMRFVTVRNNEQNQVHCTYKQQLDFEKLHGALKTQVQHFVGENVAWEKVTTN